MTTERKCKVPVWRTPVDVETMLPAGEGHLSGCSHGLIPDETSTCAICGFDHTSGNYYHPYTPSRWLCPVHGEQ